MLRRRVSYCTDTSCQIRKNENSCQRSPITTISYSWRKRFQEHAPARASEGRLIEITSHLQAHTPATAQPFRLHIELDLGHGCVLRIRGV